MRHHVTCWLWMAFVFVTVGSLAPAAAEAQTLVINPTRVAFTVSTDHNKTVTLASDTIPLVTRYELEVYLPGAAQPMTTADLGKPSAADNAEVVLDKGAVFVALPPGAYEGAVAAIGPGGVGRSCAAPVTVAVVVVPTLPTAVRIGTGGE